ncbi:hypothetical protein ETU09_09180 [Apibacter muscae]|uniref:Uncharacterized protein n=1 Tax=Apibacter muscae TaxID=2509004 RepID=A0A563D9V3_9FLAO|nr:hypothetical protein [Apibacter muscae]TWP26723.1 hypothetical protein ETU09_09180 [Apibacter muscae]
MQIYYVLGFLILFGIILLFILKKFKKKNPSLLNKDVFDESVHIPLKEKNFVVIEEHQFTVDGSLEGAKKTSRNRQMLLMDMNSYSEVSFELEKRGNSYTILVLNEEGYDIGSLKKEDQEKIINYLNNVDYKLEAGVEKFARTSDGESLTIYVTVFHYQ